MAGMQWQRWMAVAVLVALALPATAQRQAAVRVVGNPPVLIAAAEAEQPIVLRSASITGEVQAGVAQTRIELEFHNPNRRVLEGELQFPLADGQQLTGFALDIDGQLRDAVAVPKERGRQVFEAITRRSVDPGLLEQTAGNQFRLRIYPLPAGGSRRVQLTVREALPVQAGNWQWRLPLQFAGGADQVSLRLQVGGRAEGGGAPFGFKGRNLNWQGRGTALPAQLQWQLPMDGAAGMHSASLDGQHYLVAQVPVPAPAVRRLPDQVGLLWDASGSAGQRDRKAEFALLDRYFTAMGDGRVALTVLRDRATAVRRFEVRKGDWSALRRALEQEPLDGASNLTGWTPDPAVGEYLLLSDGLSNWGADTLPALGQTQRLFAISSAGARTDSVRLRGWSEANGGRLVLLDGQPQGAVQELLAEPVAVEVADAAGLHEVVVDRRSQAQGWVWVHARADSARQAMRLRINTGQWQQLQAEGDAADPGLVAGLWAQARLQQLALEPRRNREAMQLLSQRFGLVSAATSLIVLDGIDDYLRYAIRPPAPLRAEYDRRYARLLEDRAFARRQHLDAIAGQWQERAQWWAKTWPKDAPALAAPEKQAARLRRAQAMAEHAGPEAMALVVPPPAAPAPPAPPVAADLDALESVAVAADGYAPEPSANEGALEIRLGAWEPDSPVARRLRQGPAATLYTRYLAERADNANSSAFFLDVADMLLEHKQRELALRVLSNLAEMELDNRHLLRVLGYRLLQADAPQLAVPVFEQVLAMAEDEPQSFRDLGLALEAAGRPQDAVGPLYQVVEREWDGRFDGVALIALDELTNLGKRTNSTLDLSTVDPRLRRALPLDLRVVLAWDSDNSDMDLWVTDPNGERAFYGDRLTYQGGAMSQDFTGGYGPEQFSLRDAKPGIYKVEANYFGSRQQLVTGATTLMLRLSTHWGSTAQQDRAVTLRLQESDDTVLVGEFEVR